MSFLIQTMQKEKIWNELLVVCGGVLLLFAASQIQIPLEPVPINLQTVAVMLIGLTYTPRRALESHLLWLSLAAVGCPVLTGFVGGLSRFTGTTAGYLFGFVVAAYLMASLKQRFSLNSFFSDIYLTLFGTMIVFTLGVSWLAHLIGFSNAIAHGLLPFILPGIIKAGLLCTALQIVRSTRKS
jgi:biotin transport system substrate-specific component